MGHFDRVHSGLKSQKNVKNMQVIFNIYENEYTNIFVVAEYESEVKVAKNKMADPICRRGTSVHYIYLNQKRLF